MSEPAVIDLGLDRGEPEPPPGPAVRRRRRWSARARWGAAAATVLLASSLGGAAVPTGRSLERAWSLPNAGGEDLPFGTFAVRDDRLYLLARGRLTAYHLADGRVDWEIELDIADEYASIWPIADVLLVTDMTAAEVVTAYDQDSGELRWRQPGGAVQQGDDRLMLNRTGSGSSRRGSGMELIDIDPGTGKAIGSGVWLDSDSGIETPSWEAPDGARYLFDLNRDGELTRFDLATGAAVQRVQTPHVEREPDTWYNQLVVQNGLLMVSVSGGETPESLAAYDPGTLTHLWTVSGGLYSTPCGELVCVFVEEPGSGTPYEHIRAVDPVTGASPWTLRCPVFGQTSEECSYMSIYQLRPSSRLLVTGNWSTGEDTERPRTWIVDAATGTSLTAPIDWDFHGQLDDGTLLLTRQEQEARAIRVDDSIDTAEPPRTWWGRSDVDLGGIEVLGAVTADICLPSVPYLVCWTEDASTAVWLLGD